jgi:hypothetical protein
LVNKKLYFLKSKIIFFEIENSILIANKNKIKAIILTHFPFSVKNAPPVDLDNSNANEDVAPIVSDDELAPLEILMEDEEKEEKVKKDHPIIININTVLSQQAFSSPNGTDTTTSSMMLTDLNEHHDSGFMENATNKQQDDADDADADR